VVLCEGWALRRRRSRGLFSYYQLFRSALVLHSEDATLQIGYAQIALSGVPPVVAAPVEGGGHLLPDLPLPSAHQRILGRVAEHTPTGWFVSPECVSAAAAIIARLGLSLITT
jgi:hypothetical protein